MDLTKINRLEIIDFRPCSRCNGIGRVNTETDTAAGQSISFSKECIECGGLGSPGRKVIFWDENVQVDPSFQDDGRTLKLFVDNRHE